MKNLAFAMALMAPATAPMEVDQAEIRRCGDMVELVAGRESTAAGAVSEAMAPPADDADKFFISIIRAAADDVSDQLLEDWDRSPWLRSLAIPHDLASWSHCTVFTAGDQSQDWRWSDIDLEGLPTILVTPPRSGIYGDPSTVIYQSDGYDGDSRQLATDISDTIKTYVENHARSQGLEATSPPPWDVPAEDGARREPHRERIPRIPPLERPGIRLPWSLLFSGLTGLSLPLVVAAVIWVLHAVRKHRKAAGKPQILTDAQMEKLVDLLSTIADDEEEEELPERATRKKPRKKSGSRR